MSEKTLAYATRFRDSVRRIVSERIDTLRPANRIATVESFTQPIRTAWVKYAGETISVPVGTGIFEPGAGATVLIGGPSGNRFVVDVISGSFSLTGNTSGAPGQPTVEDPMTRNHHMWFRAAPGSNVTPLTSTDDSFAMRTAQVRGVVSFWPGPGVNGDLGALPYYKLTGNPTPLIAGTAGVVYDDIRCKMGNGSGRGGFLTTMHFGFIPPLPTNYEWFAGACESLIFGGFPGATNLIGVGAMVGDSVPAFFHCSDVSGFIKVPIPGVANISVNTWFEVRIYSDPRRTDAQIRFTQFAQGVPVAVANYTATSNLPVSTMNPLGVALGSDSPDSCLLAIQSMYCSLQPIGLSINS